MSKRKLFEMTEDFRSSLTSSRLFVGAVPDREQNVRIRKSFQSMALIAPIIPCDCCSRLFTRSQMVLFSRRTYATSNVILDWLAPCLQMLKSSAVGSSGLLCLSCDSFFSLQPPVLPKYAIFNGLGSDNIPPSLSGLNLLEQRLVARVMVFFTLVDPLGYILDKSTIIGNPKPRPFKIKGSTVVVPSNFGVVSKILPHPVGHAGIINVAVKRRLDFNRTEYVGTVDNVRISEAIDFLRLNHPSYADICIDYNGIYCVDDENGLINTIIPSLPRNFNSKPEVDDEQWDTNSCHLSTGPGEIAKDCLPNFTDYNMKDDGFSLSGGSSPTSSDVSESSSVKSLLWDLSSTVSNSAFDETVPNRLDYISAGSAVQFMGSKAIPESTSSLQVFETIDQTEFVLAPASGSRPFPITKRLDLEPAVFPHLFPYSNYGFTYQRVNELTHSEYIKARITGIDSRYRDDMSWCIYHQYVKDMNIIRNAANHSKLQVTGEEDIDFTDPFVLEFARSSLNPGSHLKNVCGSITYKRGIFYTALTMAQQLGNARFFITLGSNDANWYETIISILKLEGYKRDDVEERYYYLMKHDEERHLLVFRHKLLVIQMFYRRVRSFLKNVLSPESGILGGVVDYIGSIELTKRAGLHAHLLVFSNDKPVSNSAEHIALFVDKYITVARPCSDFVSPYIRFQDHICCISCSRGRHNFRKGCRYHFPHPPCSKTLLRYPMHLSEEEQTRIRVLRQSVLEHISSDCPADSVEEMLYRLSISDSDYQKIIMSWPLGQKRLVLKRSPKECFVNSYNETVLGCWAGNVDVQYVMDTYAVAYYICKYIGKNEDSESMSVSSFGTSTSNQTTSRYLNNVLDRLLVSREVTFTETLIRLLGETMKISTRKIIYIPTGYASERHRLLKSKPLIDLLEDGDSPFVDGLIQFYQHRVHEYNVRNIPLIIFAMAYDQSPVMPRRTDIIVELPSEYDYNVHSLFPNLPPVIRCVHGSVTKYYVKRKRFALPRFYLASVETNPIKFFHGCLLLFVPWVDEKSDLGNTPTQITINYGKHKSSINKYLSVFYKLNSIEQSVKMMEDSENSDSTSRRVLTLGSSSNENYKLSKERDDIITRYVACDEVEYQSTLRTLNPEQRAIHDLIYSHSIRVLNGCDENKLHLYISGEAGTGKTYLLNCIYNSINRNLGSNSCMVVCLQGLNASMAHGTTIHTFLGWIPSEETIHGDRHTMDRLRGIFSNLKYLIIDEIWLVRSDLFSKLDGRLRVIFSAPHKPFGGLNILTFGDLNQLPPIGQYIFKMDPTTVNGRINDNLWKKYFKSIDLTINHRQSGNREWWQLCQRVKNDQMTNDDYLFLASRELPQDYYLNDTNLETVLHVFRTNKQRRAWNKKIIRLRKSRLNLKIFESIAVDSKNEPVKSSTCKDRYSYMESKFRYSIGAPVMIIKNIHVQSKLCNGQMGRVVSHTYDEHLENNSVPYIIFIWSPNVTSSDLVNYTHLGLRSYLPSIDTIPLAFQQYYDDLIPIVIEPFYSRNRSRGSIIYQFPLCLSYGVTFYKIQGQTLLELVICLHSCLGVGELYVGLTRVSSSSKIHFCGQFNPKHVKKNEDVNLNAVFMCLFFYSMYVAKLAYILCMPSSY